MILPEKRRIQAQRATAMRPSRQTMAQRRAARMTMKSEAADSGEVESGGESVVVRNLLG